MPSERCSCETCTKKIGVMSFECKFCNKKYCITHQLPEAHSCDIKNSDYYNKYNNIPNITGIKHQRNTRLESM